MLIARVPAGCNRCLALPLKVVIFCAVAATLIESASVAQTTGTKSKSASAQKPAKRRGVVKPASGPLPDEALKRAQDAEKQLAANKPTEALGALTKLDVDFPGHAAISLRLAQIYDRQDNQGPSLFFYRRYMLLVGDRAREDAQTRLFALELSPDARKSAQDFASKMGEPTSPVSTPAPFSKVEIATTREDGSLLTLNNPQEVQELARTGPPPAASPGATSAGPTPYVVPIESVQQAAQVAAQLRANPNSSMVLSGTGNQVSLKPAPPVATAAAAMTPVVMAATPAPTMASNVAPPPAPTAPPVAIATRSVYAAGTPEQGVDEDAQLARAFASGGTAAARSTPQPAPFSAQPGAAAPTPVATIAAVTPIAPNATPYVPATAAGEKGSYTYISPTPVQEVVSPRAEGFFKVTKIGGTKATIKLFNDVDDSIATIKIIPVDEGAAANAILSAEETRTLQLAPGDYDVYVTVATRNYPPLTLMEARFTSNFEGGTQYLRRFNKDNTQQVR